MKPLKHYEREALIWGASISANEKILLLAMNSLIDAEGQRWTSATWAKLERMTGLGEALSETLDALAEKGICSSLLSDQAFINFALLGGGL